MFFLVVFNLSLTEFAFVESDNREKKIYGYMAVCVVMPCFKKPTKMRNNAKNPLIKYLFFLSVVYF